MDYLGRAGLTFHRIPHKPPMFLCSGQSLVLFGWVSSPNWTHNPNWASLP